VPFLIPGAIILAITISPNPTLTSLVAVLFSAIFASVDAHFIQAYKYKITGPKDSLTTFLWCLLLWVVGLPWYLMNRQSIKSQRASIWSNFKEAPPPDSKYRNQDRVSALIKLGRLREEGVLSDEEFEKEKLKLIK